MGYLLLKSPTSIAHVPALEANKLRDFGGSGYLKDQMTLKKGALHNYTMNPYKVDEP